MSTPARWILPPSSAADVAALARQCGLRLPAARVLWARGLRDAQSVEHFLNPKLGDLHDPFLLKGMEAAVERVRAAVKGGERVLLYGDYDTDGTAAVVILKKALEALGLDAAFHIPDRLKDGYGMQPETLAAAAADGVRLVISVDTGIRAVEAVRAARAAGLDVIVTDHHLPEEELPPANAILNPNQPGCKYPNKSLCGAGVAFKLIQALMERENWPPARIVRWCDSLLTMVALATVADVVPLNGENRVIVARGLHGLETTRNAGLAALKESAGFAAGRPVSVWDVGFRLSPRINAAGRMSNARDVIELFLTADPARARRIAVELDALNIERREAENAIVKSILAECAASGDVDGRRGLVFAAQGWHRGVVGIVASRVVEEFGRPALVLSIDPETGLAQGSGRSVAGFHLLEAVESLGDMLLRFGGHKAAVGLTLEAARIPELRERFDAAAQARLSEDDLAPAVKLDAEIEADEIEDTAVEEVLRLAPFGLSNPNPVFLLRAAELAETPVVFKERHVRMKFRRRAGALVTKAWDFVGRLGELQAGRRYDLALTFEPDAYSASRGYANWASTVRELRAAGPQ